MLQVERSSTHGLVAMPAEFCPTLYNAQKTHQSVIAEMMHFLLFIFRKSSKASSLRLATVDVTPCIAA